jgi:formylglycine-generating enzyme required for sulfatase activity
MDEGLRTLAPRPRDDCAVLIRQQLFFTAEDAENAENGQAFGVIASATSAVKPRVADPRVGRRFTRACHIKRVCSYRAATGRREGVEAVRSADCLRPVVIVLVLVGCNPRPPKDRNILDLGQGMTMELVLVPAGEFTMGSPDSEEGREIDEGPQRRVQIAKPFYMGKHEVTHGQFARFVSESGYVTELEKRKKCPNVTETDYEPVTWRGGTGLVRDDTHPVVEISRYDAAAFCEWLSLRTGRSVRLPTEAEWEYACRAGSTTRFCFGDSDDGLGEYAWYVGNEGGMEYLIRPVGQKRPSAWDLYDMHGNVAEWCSDTYRPYPSGTDKSGRPSHDFDYLGVQRGGTSYSLPQHCRSAMRSLGHLLSGESTTGFRVAMSVDPTGKASDGSTDADR